MHALTTKIVAELDMLYGLYQLAIDLVKRINPEDEAATARILEARQKILDKTTEASKATAALLKPFYEMKIIPANEMTLVDEKRKLILDLSAKMNLADNQVFRLMHARLAAIRKEMAGQVERKNAMRAYLQAPQAQFMVHE